MSSYHIRLSRISHPRSSLAAILLLIAVFLGFGVVAQACIPDSQVPSVQVPSVQVPDSSIQAMAQPQKFEIFKHSR